MPIGMFFVLVKTGLEIRNQYNSKKILECQRNRFNWIFYQCQTSLFHFRETDADWF